MSDHFTCQRTPSQFALFMPGPAALVAWLDDDKYPVEPRYMPCGAGLKGTCPWAVAESANDTSANAAITTNKRRAHSRFRISTQNTLLKPIFCLCITSVLPFNY